jgi:aarF domain-containing kinase
MSEEFRKDYATFWKGLLSGDMVDVRRIAGKWGVAKESLDLLASGVLLKPWRSTKKKDVGAFIAYCLDVYASI